MARCESTSGITWKSSPAAWHSQTALCAKPRTATCLCPSAALLVPSDRTNALANEATVCGCRSVNLGWAVAAAALASLQVPVSRLCRAWCSQKACIFRQGNSQRDLPVSGMGILARFTAQVARLCYGRSHGTDFGKSSSCHDDTRPLLWPRLVGLVSLIAFTASQFFTTESACGPRSFHQFVLVLVSLLASPRRALDSFNRLKCVRFFQGDLPANASLPTLRLVLLRCIDADPRQGCVNNISGCPRTKRC